MHQRSNKSAVWEHPSLSTSTDSPKKEPPKAPTPPKALEIEVAKKQHDLLSTLLNQQAQLSEQIRAVTAGILSGSSVTIPDRAQLVGTGTGTKFGKRKHYVVLSV
jgi:hypothetical protein